MYTTLQRHHLDQVHDLLRRAFWEGIDGERSRLLPPIFALTEHSERCPELLSGALHHRGNIQKSRRRRSLAELAAGNVHHIPRGQTWLG